jgi:hypothetical protein
MADTRLHRGAHPEDAELFASSQWPVLRNASSDLCWLLDRGYAVRSAVALVGDRHRLVQRQRIAVARCACSLDQLNRRSTHHVSATALARSEVWIDGFNLLVTLESALAGGVILLGRDGCYRDMASVHGTYREVAETARAARLLGNAVAGWSAARCRWLLDRPVGNSGRLKATLETVAAEASWSWEVAVEFNPDRVLSESTAIVATSDSGVLDRAERWCNLTREIITAHVSNAFIVDLRPNGICH